MDSSNGMGDSADTLTPLIKWLFGSPPVVGVRLWDGSRLGPTEGPVLVLRSPLALRYLVWNPGELGLARGYVTGELDVEGDLRAALRLIWRAWRPDGWVAGSPRDRVAATALAIRNGLAGPQPPVPASEVNHLRGRLHSRSRDRAAVSHNYDVSNDFYQLFLDPAMVYSCAYWTSDALGYTLADAQRDKLDQVCRKLNVGPGTRLLDVGCGWGALIMHAAEHFGAHATGVTLSSEQHELLTARLKELDPYPSGGTVEARLQDYRDVTDGPYDAVSAIEMSEHVGARNYPRLVAGLRDLLAPEGRLLVQQMSRGPATTPGGGALVESYIAPDMHMRTLGSTISVFEEADLEVIGVEAMREHYARTLHAWTDAIEERAAEISELIGAESARVWRIYMASDALAFEQGRSGVDQILATRSVGAQPK
ncbi:class I SAM-dependent methyltransferase [Streptomyces sp. NPDC005125]